MRYIYIFLYGKEDKYMRLIGNIFKMLLKIIGISLFITFIIFMFAFIITIAACAL